MITIPPSIRAALWHELGDHGLLLDVDTYRDYLARVTITGCEELASLREGMTRGQWSLVADGLDAVGSERDLERILGFGRLLTDYASGPADDGLTSEAYDAVGRLGALSNLIVTLFDTVFESESAVPFSPLTLEALSAGKGVLLRQRELLTAAPSHRALHRLTYRYFQHLRELPGAKERPELVCLVKSAITRMYEAESETALRHDCRDQALRRKSSLPFAVIGLPIWLATRSASEAGVRSHARWLYRLGEFIGWLDDIVDLDHDRRCGHPNRVDRALASSRQSQTALVSTIARTGWRVQSSWRAHEPERYRHAHAVLPAVIMSWFGGEECGIPA